MNFDQILSQKKIRKTAKLIAVLDFLSVASVPQTTKQIFHQLKQSGIKLDLVTVYRIVDKLVENQLIKTINFRDGVTRYELVAEHHHHLVCNDCGKIEPFYGEWLKKAEKQIQKLHQFQVQEHVLEFFGTCHNCSRKNL